MIKVLCVMKEKQSLSEVDKTKLYHVVFPTYGRLPLLVNPEQQQYVCTIVEEMIRFHTINISAYKVLTDHVHLLVKKEPGQSLPYIVKIVKGRTTHYFFQKYSDFKIDVGRSRLWAKGYHYTEIESERQLHVTTQYIKNNFDK